MEWKTKIAKSDEKDTLVRGYPLSDMIKNLTFTQSIFLTLKGELPSDSELKLFDAILISSIDHGISPPSVMAARAIASGGNKLHTSVAGGLMSLGDSHGGAIEACATLLNSKDSAEEIVKKFEVSKKRIPGFGHKLYKDVDPRTKELFDMAKDLKLYGKHCEKAEEISKLVSKTKGKPLCLNIDGAVGALCLELGFDTKVSNALFFIPRIVGLSAHVAEELNDEKPFRRIDNGKYEGKDKRELL